MDIKRRQLLTSPGDNLLLSQSALEVFVRHAQWVEATGLDGSRTTFNPLCSVPLPLYEPPAPGLRQFPNVNPELLWHPLFWLPNRVAARYNLPTGVEGETQPESDAVRSIRIALELGHSGLYNREDGWLDILATVGLDVENDADLGRIEEWQQGAPDELLDSIDLDLYLKLDNDPYWALNAAVVLLDPLTHASWAILSDSLLDFITDLASPEAGKNQEQMRDGLRLAAVLAGVQLAAVPTDADEEISEVFWARIEDQAQNGHFASAADFLAGPVHEACEWLRLTRETWWEDVDELRSLEAV